MEKKTIYKKDIDYTIEVSNGRMIVHLLQRGNNGLYQSASSPYPDYEHIYNDKTREVEIIKLSRKQCIDRLLHTCLVNAAKVDR